jgi:hypothetical protein
MTRVAVAVLVAAGGVHARALLLELALRLLALQLGVVHPLRAGDPAAEQRDRAASSGSSFAIRWSAAR